MPQNPQWRAVTVHQLGVRIALEQERALRAKFHLENALPWDALSQLTESLAVAERDGPDWLATMIGKFRPQIEPLIVAGRAVRRFSELYPGVACHSRKNLPLALQKCRLNVSSRKNQCLQGFSAV